MPSKVPVVDLHCLCLKLLANIIEEICRNPKIDIHELSIIVSYFQGLPTKLRGAVYDTFLNEYKKLTKRDFLNEKHLLLSTSLHAQELFMNEFQNVLQYTSIFEGNHVRKVTFNSNIFEYTENDYPDGEPLHSREMLYRPLYHFMKTFTNLAVFHSIRMCDDRMFEIFAQHCPFLEEISVELCYNVGDIGVSSLCGFNSASEAKSVLRTGEFIQRNTVCRNLKSVNLDYTLASNLSFAIFLNWCPKLEYLSVTPDINIGDVFTTMFGFDSLTYDSITRQFALTTLESLLEIDENVLSLIVQTCPHLRDIKLRCYGMQRRDKNLLANLLNLRLKKLSLFNCHTDVLMWYLNIKGTELKELNIEHLISAPPTLYLDRSHLQSLISYCPNLETFSLRMCGNVSINPNVPYSSFGKSLKYFTSLQLLIVEGVNLQSDDIKILMQKCQNLQEVRFLCQSLDNLEDALLYELLSEGALSNLKTLYVFRPLLTMTGLRRLLAECPHLQHVGPLSSWAIPKKEREALLQEIKLNNWDLCIDSPENVYHFF